MKEPLCARPVSHCGGFLKGDGLEMPWFECGVLLVEPGAHTDKAGGGLAAELSPQDWEAS